MRLTRRQFTRNSLAGAAMYLHGVASAAPAAKLPLGLQLYSVRQMLAQDYDGTLRQLAALGYREVEAAGFFGHAAAQVAASMHAAGLTCISAHYPYDELTRSLDETIAFGNQLGLKYMICSFPGFRDAARVQGKSYPEKARSFTLDDFTWNAHRFNEIGAKVKAAGMQFGYHNHTMEFAPQQGTVPFDAMLQIADPQLVTFELDCGWVVVGGGDPVGYLQRYPRRFSMVHIKDFKRQEKSATESPVGTELGRGMVPNERILAAARTAGIRHCFVEQEEYDMPVVDALKIDAKFIQDQNL